MKRLLLLALWLAYIVGLVFLPLPPMFSAYAQTDPVNDCRLKSLSAPVADPAKIIQAQEDAFQKCIAAALPDKQRRQLALYKSAQTVCNDAADNEVKRDSLTTAAERTKIYTRCMKGAGYQ